MEKLLDHKISVKYVDNGLAMLKGGRCPYLAVSDSLGLSHGALSRPNTRTQSIH